EVALLRGDRPRAAEHLAAATSTNPRAATGFFLRAYLAWKGGDDAAAVRLLQQTRAALGPDWQPKGATSEGDVARKQHVEMTPLAPYLGRWTAQTNLGMAFRDLDERLSLKGDGGRR
ncbi:MAG: hypothetical protein ACYC23_20305, partial [Limisphaerales bacterium]